MTFINNYFEIFLVLLGTGTLLITFFVITLTLKNDVKRWAVKSSSSQAKRNGFYSSVQELNPKIK